jgi:phosphate transport system substrate-binding protein
MSATSRYTRVIHVLPTMNSCSLGNCLRWPFLRAALCVLALFAVAVSLRAQSAENLSAVKRVAVEWSSGDRGSAATRDRVVQKLKASKALELVANSGRADGILRGEVKVWVNGYVTTSPRSKAAKQAIYRGYASVELAGKDGRTLWSYLVTPKSPGWKTISDDLGDQLAQALLGVLGKKERSEVAGAGTGGGPGASNAKPLDIQGAGATFPAPIYRKWFEDFSRARPDLTIQYTAVGSEEGIKRVQGGSVDFGASDMPLGRERLDEPGKKLAQVATVLGAVVPIYNVKGATETLNFTGEVLAGMFLGKIQRWNAPEIRAINKHAHLPDEAIVVIHRSEGSGTTFVWTDYLSKVNAEWKSAVGAGTSVKWPVGSGAEGNDGVAEEVRKTPNSIGYVEFLYALQHELEYAAVRNASGEFVRADLDSVTAAAKAGALPGDQGFSMSITNASGRHVYPIATFTWVLVPGSGGDAAKRAAVRDLLRWMLTTGQKECEGLGYAPLPGELANRELAALGKSGN